MEFKKGESFIMLRNFKENKFYKETVTGYYFTAYTKDGLKVDLFTHKTSGKWQVDSPLCGAMIVNEESSRKNASERATEKIGKITNERYMKFIERSNEIIKNGENTTKVSVYE